MHTCTTHHVKSVRRKDFDIPERSVKHANDNKGKGIRANSAKSEGGNLELTSCTHTQIVRAYLSAALAKVHWGKGREITH